MTHTPKCFNKWHSPPLKFYNATDNCILSHIDTYIIEYSIRKVNVGGDELICCIYKTFGWDFHLLLHLRECNLLKEELTSYFSSSLLLKTLLLWHLRRGFHHLQSLKPPVMLEPNDYPSLLLKHIRRLSSKLERSQLNETLW